MTRRRVAGLTIVELLISMTIGLLLLGALSQVLVLHSRQFADSEALAELQDHASAAIRFLRRDITLAGHWGMASSATHIDGASTIAVANPMGIAVPSRCAPRFTLDLMQAATITTHADQWQCGVTARGDSPALVLRYASTEATEAHADRVQLWLTPAGGQTTHAEQATPGQRHDLQVMGYYIAPASSLFSEQPVLRRLTLRRRAGQPAYVDEEVAVGVEYWRLRAAIDTNNDGQADSWVESDDTRLAARRSDGAPEFPVAALEVSLIVRAAAPMQRAIESQRFWLGDTEWQAPADNFLRVHVTTTVALKNWRRSG
ncbi:MAG: PilW family protein [Pseudomonadota bacterium]